MCNPETKQSYVVLRAFANAGAVVSGSQLQGEIVKIVSEVGASSVEDLGPLNLGAILNELAMGKMTRPSADKRWIITERGRDLMKVQRGFVAESAPALARAP